MEKGALAKPLPLFLRHGRPEKFREQATSPIRGKRDSVVKKDEGEGQPFFWGPAHEIQGSQATRFLLSEVLPGNGGEEVGPQSRKVGKEFSDTSGRSPPQFQESSQVDS